MISFDWWEYKGKKRKLPKNLILGKNVFLDRRYKVNRDFLADKDWVHKQPLNDYYYGVLHRELLRPTLRETTDKDGTIRFVRYTDLIE